MENQQHIDNLLVEFKEQREEIKKMLDELEILRKNVDSLFPGNRVDKRFKMFFEEKVKAATSFFNVLLDMRKEITKSLKDEIDIRRRLELKDKELDFDEMLDIRKLADKVEGFKKKAEKIKKDRRVVDTDLPDDVEIPGVNAPVR
jgi:hypothetical protein